MKAWVVVESADFDSSRKRQCADFRAKLLAHTDSPKSKTAKSLCSALSDFHSFLEKLKKLAERTDPTILQENQLAYVQDDPTGLPIFSAVHKEWRCLYVVNVSERVCTAIRIEHMSPNLSNVEHDRHENGTLLNQL